MNPIESIRSILAGTPSVLRSLHASIGDELALRNYGVETFSPFDVVGHLILGERLDWIPRTRIILEHGESRPFDPFPWDGIDDATTALTMTQRLDVFADLRHDNLQSLDSLSLELADLDRTGLHPKLGVVTLGEMLTAWRVHDIHHIAQVCKAVNYQAREAIGPWRPYVNSIPPDRPDA